MRLVSEDLVDRSGRGVYGISVAAELSGIGEQSLRLYEQRRLLTPSRTVGGTRRYSDDDLVRLQRITALLAAGVNVAGIGQILDLQDRNTQLESDNTALKSDNVRLASAHRRAGASQEDHASEGNDHDE
jgi:MerR family transcriptional regulator/heat shock protein HspR